jgi:DNA polymerase-3 subunit delta
MIIFLYGLDTYRSWQKLNEIVEHYKKIHKSGLNLKYFEGENLAFGDFKDELHQSPIFKEKRLFVLKDIFSNQNFEQKFLEAGDFFKKTEDVILIYETSPIPENNSLFKFLIRNAKFQEFKLLDEVRLKIWIKKKFEKYGTKIENQALEKLVEFVGNNLWQISNEIRKLVNYKKGEKVKKEDVELLIKPKIETDIFKTIDAIASKNKKQALELIHKHLEKGDSPLYLLSMINFQFRNLLIIKDLIQKYRSPYILSKVTHLHPYIIKKSCSLAQKFTIQELKKIYQKIYQVDLDIKTGRMEPEVALDLLIAEI